MKNRAIFYDHLDRFAKKVSLLEESKDPSLELEEILENYSDQSIKEQAMMVAQLWMNDEDHTFANLDAYIQGMIEMEDDEDYENEDYEVLYNEILQAVGESLISMGANLDDVQKMIRLEEDVYSAKVHGTIKEAVNPSDINESTSLFSDETLLSNFIAGADNLISEKVITKIRGGEKIRIKKRPKKRRISSKQRAALKLARRKANTGSAKKRRMKSLKIRKRMGL